MCARGLFTAAALTAFTAATQPRVIEPAAPPLSYVISYYDLPQNQELSAIEHHLEVTDLALLKTQDELSKLERETSDMQGANRVWFWLLGGMITAIGVAFWKGGGIKTGGDK